MDYFDLTPASVPSSNSSGSSNSTGRGRGPPGHNPTQLQHALISLADGQDDHATPVSTPLDGPGVTTSISTAFHPFLSIDDANPDVVLVSVDGVHFYTHRHRLLAISSNRMGNLLPSPGAVVSPPLLAVVPVPHPSEVVNVLLHIIYGLSCAQYLPTLETVEAAVDSLSLLYGVSVAALAAPGMPLFTLIHSFAPVRPLDAYALAAHHAMEDLAVTISSHLLAYNLARLPDTAAEKMGPIYLKRLFLLHQSRIVALRNILFKPPAVHLPVTGCGQEIQQMMMRAWALAVAQLVWDVLPSVSTSALQALLEPIGASMNCPLCIAALQRRVQEVVYEWSAVKRTI
ncbi:hypothetical protein L226DRAFT_528175 [Lentinus tigrinus ALCF2SS1-7]|uniref:uncharacterized protein n=1 Tax=Lentinus tigrinus ALCF2SS1-7 TaxID=1328758 RepID=UPI001165FC38|nr:hypothetical protein L226DRAFT_528175 [Lentinus tigrinus ALCF2SS1-7]